MRLAVQLMCAGTALLVASAVARAQPLLGAEQWNPETHLWLARAMVAEAGFKGERDHVAIAYVLRRRFERMQKTWPALRFVEVIRAYCAGLGGFHRGLTSRQRWVRELGLSTLEPQGWPARLAWSVHRPLWQSVIERASSWREGLLSDPCAGRAWHWGGTIDTPGPRMRALQCGGTLNTFFRVSATSSGNRMLVRSAGTVAR